MVARNRFSRRDVLKAGGGAAALLPLSAAASPGRGPSRAPVRAQELAEAEITFFFGANPAEAETRQKVVDAFMAKFPQITVKTQIAEGDAIVELQTMAAGGSTPDVMMAWELSYSGLGERGMYADLNAFLLEDTEFKAVVDAEMVPSLLQMFQWNGAQYVLPEQYAGVFLYYNKDLFEAAGVAPPPADWNDTTWTYDKVLETAQALTVGDGDRVSQYGFVDGWWPPLSAMVWGTGNGGNWFDTYVNPTASTLSDPKMIDAVQWYADLVHVHNVAPNAEAIATQGGADMFMGGRAAMCLVGHWFYPAFSAIENLNFDVAVFPVGPGGTTPKTDLGSTGLAISATTEHPEAAWEFVKFSTGPEGQSVIAESGLFIPVLRSVGQSEAFLGAHTKVQNTQVFIDAMEASIPLPITPAWNAVAEVWSREVVRVMNGEAPASEVLPALDPQINELLAQGSDAVAPGTPEAEG